VKEEGTMKGIAGFSSGWEESHKASHANMRHSLN